MEFEQKDVAWMWRFLNVKLMIFIGSQGATYEQECDNQSHALFHCYSVLVTQGFVLAHELCDGSMMWYCPGFQTLKQWTHLIEQIIDQFACCQKQVLSCVLCKFHIRHAQ